MITFYHATPVDASTIISNGLRAKYSESMQHGIYVAKEPELAMATAEALHGGSSICLVVIAAAPDTVFHPDEDVFLYPEVFEDLSDRQINRVFSGIQNPASAIKRALAADDETAIAFLIQSLTVTAASLVKHIGIMSHGVYPGDIGFDGGIRIIGVGTYDAAWQLQQIAYGEHLPDSIKRA